MAAKQKLIRILFWETKAELKWKNIDQYRDLDVSNKSSGLF